MPLLPPEFLYGLYLRYVRSLDAGRGTFFAARTEDGRVVGLSSALLDDQGVCRVDGFAHHNFSPAWYTLLEAACTWASAQGVSALGAVVSIEDEEKQSLFESIGFVPDGTHEAFDLEGRAVAACKMIGDPVLFHP